MDIRTKRVYEPVAAADGYRALVERLWPRGVRKADLKFDSWLKDVGPSTELRKWFNHDPERWMEFQKRYRAELRQNKDAVGELKAHAKGRTVTLVYAAHDEEHNSALVLKRVLERRR